MSQKIYITLTAAPNTIIQMYLILFNQYYFNCNSHCISYLDHPSPSLNVALQPKCTKTPSITYQKLSFVLSLSLYFSLIAEEREIMELQ